MSAIACLHGFTGTPDVFAPVLERLGGRPRVMPILFGHGPRGEHEPARTFEDEVQRLAGVIRGAIGEGGTLVGYSLGARFALALAVTHPGLCSGVLLSGVNPGISSAREREARAESDERWACLLEREGLASFTDAWVRQPLFAWQQALPEAMRRREQARRLSHTAAGLASSLRQHGLARMPDYRPALPRLALPVTLVTGELDAKFTAIGGELAQVIRGARHVIVPRSGHNVVLERPEAVAQAIQEQGT